MGDSFENERDGTAAAVSLIVPTFHEVENAPELLARLAAVCAASGLNLEVLFVDDDSRDGIAEAVSEMGLPWAGVLVRSGERGLSSAVLAGIAATHGEVIVVMDADLSHPPETIPALLDALEGGADFAIGSRYVTGGSTDAAWGLTRWFISKTATLIARPFTTVKDPMSGFFAFRRALLDNAVSLNPVGYKIGLEIMVKCGCRNVREIPIHFTERRHGQSKLSLREHGNYLVHIGRLSRFVYRSKRR